MMLMSFSITSRVSLRFLLSFSSVLPLYCFLVHIIPLPSILQIMSHFTVPSVSLYLPFPRSCFNSYLFPIAPPLLSCLRSCVCPMYSLHVLDEYHDWTWPPKSEAIDLCMLQVRYTLTINSPRWPLPKPIVLPNHNLRIPSNSSPDHWNPCSEEYARAVLQPGLYLGRKADLDDSDSLRKISALKMLPIVHKEWEHSGSQTKALSSGFRL